MKTVTAQTIATTAIVAFVSFTFPVSTFAADLTAEQGVSTVSSVSNTDHKALAQYHKNQADEFQAKIAAEIDAVNHKPRTSFFGRNAKPFKQHVDYKIHQYQMAVEDNLKKAAYHREMEVNQTLRPASTAARNPKG